ncbi:PilZ domain-containing protein [Natronospira bacteriovora]|uniref:Cyclic diguanosine monophosphate-binding protein n=1 Tax=Natronospira bacteriovora TaxID=3069753 RepID=A0ABU0W9B8_9GAMM|nr:PilZ domain-containing protein [Natronospira sp. AB-CW4]MDQ2070639.1 PilZ domain-containing protein [Natronospira sp. AB-CW4]
MSDNDKHGGERRRHTRVNFRANARLFSDTTYWPCELLNVSVKGALLTCPEGWKGSEGDRCLLEITLDQSAPVEMEVNVVRVEEDRLACDWDMFDVNGFVQLRRMLERQLGDPEQVAREMAILHELDRSEGV